jgi:hypothetical protein
MLTLGSSTKQLLESHLIYFEQHCCYLVELTKPSMVWSNGDVIKVLEKWGDICELVSKAHGDTDDNGDTSRDGPQESDDGGRHRKFHKQVVRVVDVSKPIVTDLLILGNQMKDQDKRKPEDAQILVKDAACRY